MAGTFGGDLGVIGQIGKEDEQRLSIKDNSSNSIYGKAGLMGPGPDGNMSF